MYYYYYYNYQIYNYNVADVADTVTSLILLLSFISHHTTQICENVGLTKFDYLLATI